MARRNRFDSYRLRWLSSTSLRLNGSPGWKVSELSTVWGEISSVPLITICPTLVAWLGTARSCTRAVRATGSTMDDVSTSASAYPRSHSSLVMPTRIESSFSRSSGWPRLRYESCRMRLRVSSAESAETMTSVTSVGAPSRMSNRTATCFSLSCVTVVSTSVSRKPRL